MSDEIDAGVKTELSPSFEEAWAAAMKFAYGSHGNHFEGTLFQQGGRYMFSTAMRYEEFVRVASANSSLIRTYSDKREDKKVVVATEGDEVDDIAETTNRPIDKGHVRAITKYVADAVRHGEKYIMPPATLNLRGETATLFTIKTDSTITPAILVLPPHARFEITDAQHRREGLSHALDDRNVGRQLLRDGIAVMVTFENDLAQVHQDFADASKTKPIAGSLVAVYDGRLPVNALAIHLARTCPLFRHTVDATSKGSSLSAGSVKVWNTNVLRQFVKYAGLNSREGDDTWNTKFTQIYGEQSDARYQKFRDYLVLFIEAATEHVSLFSKLARLAPEDMSYVPKLRAMDGGQILMTAPGMNILGALAHDLYRSVYMKGEDIGPWLVKIGQVDWSYDGKVWGDTLMVAGKVSVSAKAVKDAITEVEKELGLETMVVEANAERARERAALRSAEMHDKILNNI